jgi:hypothetical protein
MSYSNFEDSLSSNTLSPASHKIHKHCISPSNSKKSTRRAWWTIEEDKLVLDLIGKMGENWALISSKMSNRTGKQVRDRYLNHLRPNINREQWSEDEDKKILDLMRKLGHKWKKISTLLPGRTENQVKTRYYKYLKGKELGMVLKREEAIKIEPHVHKACFEPPKFITSTPSWNPSPMLNFIPQLALQTKIDALKLYINVANIELLRLTSLPAKF